MARRVKPRHAARKPLPRRMGKWIALGLVIVLVSLAGAGVYFKQRFEGNIETQDFISEEVTGVARPEPLPEVKGALNILIMGSDTRANGNGKGIGGETPGLSDTTILLHISEDRTRAYGVSIPRDTMIDRPECPLKDGEGTDPGGLTQFNQAYAIGGPACTVATVEANTGIRINHFAVVDFNGFRDVVDAVGGVRMCVPTEVNDPIGKIYLEAGTYTMNGDQALDYVRLRHGIGVELGDIGRMKRQQAFISALIGKVMDQGTLADPTKILNLLEAGTKSLTTDPGLADLRKLAGLASSLNGIGMDKIKFVTVPFELWPLDPNRVVWSEDADELWTRIKEDRPLPRSVSKEGISPRASEAAGEAAPKTKPRPSNPIDDSQREAYGLC